MDQFEMLRNKNVKPLYIKNYHTILVWLLLTYMHVSVRYFLREILWHFLKIFCDIIFIGNEDILDKNGENIKRRPHNK